MSLAPTGYPIVATPPRSFLAKPLCDIRYLGKRLMGVQCAQREKEPSTFITSELLIKSLHISPVVLAKQPYSGWLVFSDGSSAEAIPNVIIKYFVLQSQITIWLQLTGGASGACNANGKARRHANWKKHGVKLTGDCKKA